jgi:hypothetical protein
LLRNSPITGYVDGNLSGIPALSSNRGVGV